LGAPPQSTAGPPSDFLGDRHPIARLIEPLPGRAFATLGGDTAAVLPAVERTILLVATSAPAAVGSTLASFARQRNWRLLTDFVHTGTVPIRWRGDGVILFNSYPSDRDGDLASVRLPCVSVSLAPECRTLPKVEPDQLAIGRLAARHLLERDCREFVWAPFTDDLANHNRLRGFQSFLRLQGIDCHLLPPAYRRLGYAWNDNGREWEQAALALLRGLRGNVGVFAFNDCLGQRIESIAGGTGLLVPDQVAIIGVGNEVIDCESGPVSLTSIDLDLEGMTARALDILDGMMNGRDFTGSVLHPPKGVITRASTTVVRLQDTRIQQAIAYIGTHSADPHLSVASVADKVGISRRQLERDFRSFKGCTVREYIEDMRMQAAARLVLEHPQSKILAVAEAIGIPDPNSFFRKFRKRFGTTPAAFRRQFSSTSEHDVLERHAS